MKNPILRNILMLFLFSCLLHTPVLAADITFDSFEAAEAAAKKRADEYQQRMQEHIKSINDDWEKQQKDLGSDSSSPDITKITTKADGQKSSDTDASKSMEDAVNSSVNKLKDDMISKAAPGSTGFAGGAAGYQWSVKFKNGKYVLSDSYNEAEFNTGKKKEAETPAPQPEPAKDGSDENQDETPVVTANPIDDPDTTPAPATTVAAKPEPAADPKTGADSTGKPADTDKASPAATTAPAAPPEEASKPGAGVDPAPVKLPPPSVRMVIQHPTEFSEEVFASNATSDTTANYKLDKFKIPEDTRIKISVEVGDDVQPEDVSMIVTDDQGDTAPVTLAKLKNYRHMFRVPSEDKYSACVYITDKKSPGNQQKKILQVLIPVSKVDFESRTIDNQKGDKSGSGSANSSMSTSDTSSSAGSSNVDHSSFGRAQQVDLSDLYSDSSASNSDTGTGGSVSGSNNASAGGQSAATGQDDGNGDSSAAGARAIGSDGSSGSSEAGNDSATADPGNNQDSSPATSDNTTENGAFNSDNSSVGSEGAPGTAGGSSSSEGSNSGDSASTGNSSSNAYSSADGNGSGSGVSDGVDAGAALIDQDAAGNATGNTENSAAGAADGSSTTNSGDAAKTAGKGDQAGLPVPVEDDPFILGLSLKAEAQKVFQSFDFVDGTSQTSAAIKAGGEVAFSLSLSAQVEPESVLIKLSDGSQEIRGNLKRMGESFVYVFPAPTDRAFIEVSGKTVKSSFNYRVGIPVK